MTISVEVDNEGRFATSELMPGTYKALWMPDHGAAGPERIIEIPDQEDVRLDLQWPEGKIRGIVLDQQGAPVPSVQVSEEDSGASALTGMDGLFVLGGLPSGTARLWARTRDGAVRTRVPVVEGSSDQFVTLVLREETTRLVTAKVTTEDGSPASGAWIFLETSSGESRTLTAGSDGRSEAKFESSMGRVRVAALHEGNWSFGPWVDEETASLGLSARIRRGGTLVLSARTPVSGIRLETPQGWELATLLRAFSVRLAVPADLPLRLTGLPPGYYRIVAGDSVKTASVEAGQVRKVDLSDG